VDPNSRYITRFDCHATVCLPDEVQKCLWSQEATGRAWIGLEQNIIDTAVNKRRKSLLACVRIEGQRFKQLYCRQLKNELTRWTVSHSVRCVNKMCFYALC